MRIFRFKTASAKPSDSLVFIFLAALAVAVPTVFFLWSVARAMENESAARRQEQTELNQLQVREVQRSINAHLSRIATGKVWALKNFDGSKPQQGFRQFAKSEVADGLVILDAKETPVYPLLTSIRSRIDLGDHELQALDLRDRFALSLDRPARALGVLKKFSSPELRKARDTTGRLIYPNLLAYILPTLDDGHPKRSAFLKALARSLNEPSMPTSQRLFLAGELGRVDAGQSQEYEEFYSRSLEVLSEPLQLPAPGMISRLGRGSLWIFLSEDRRFLAVFDEGKLVERFDDIVSEVTHDQTSLQFEVIPPGMAESETLSSRIPEVSLPAGRRLPGWELRAFQTIDEGPVSVGRRNFYLATAAMALTLVGGLAWLALRSYIRQAKETQLRNDFLSTVSHELRTPLTSTRMLIDTLAAGHYKDPERTKKYLDVIARENSRLSHLVETFLTYTRMERGKLKFEFHPVAPEDVAASAEASVHERFRAAGVDFTFDVAEDLPAISADAETLSSALINLLDNAFKYTGTDKQIGLRVLKRSGNIHFAVVDNGEGLSARDRKLIVERFYRTESELTRNSGGSGLGLSIVKFIVEGHGGSLHIDSQPGKGSVFTIIIPILKK